MYDYGYYDYGSSYGSVATGIAGLAIFSVIMWIVSLGVGVFTLVCMWKVFTKAGKPGWAAIVPIYNVIVILEIVELPMWYIALFFVPFANIYAIFKIYIELAHKFGKSTGFGIGLVFLAPIFLGLLAFGKDSNYKYNVVNTHPTYQQPMQNFNQPINVQPQQTIQPEPMVQPIPPVQPVTQQEPVQPKFCTKCGAQTLPGSKFCVKCGNQL